MGPLRPARHRQLTAVALVFVAAAAASGGTPLPAAPYDALRDTFGRFLDPADPLAWPAKVHAVGRDEYHFWRGTRDLFYAWCAEHCRDWMADSDDVVVSQGDLHLGNFGAYAARPFGSVAYGLVDFDDSARLPFQLELVQGLVTFELLARQNGIDLTDARRTELHTALFDAYADALARPDNDADAGLPALLPSRAAPTYAEDLDHFTQNARFRATVENKHGKPTDVLRPISPARRATLADALADAVAHDQRLAALLQPHDAAAFRAALQDAAERTRLDSSGSQGLSKVLVLLRPFTVGQPAGLLYLKQEVPSAAERAGLVPPDPRPPAQRSVNDLDALTHGRSLAASWCQWEGRSYWVSVKEPWSIEVDDASLRDFDALRNAARVWSRVLADAHRDVAARLSRRFTPAVRTVVVERAVAYLSAQSDLFARFAQDPRTVADTARYARALAERAGTERAGLARKP